MLHLARPLYLLLLLLLPLAIWWLLRRRRHGVPHPSLALFAHLPLGRAPRVRHGGLVLRLAGLVFLVLALAQPRWPDLRTRIDTEGIALMILVDVSGSMAESDFFWNDEPMTRLDAVKRVFHLFVAGNAAHVGKKEAKFEGRQTDLVGLVCFATRPETTCPLTLSHSALLRMLDAEQPRGVPGESETNLSDALAAGLARLRAAGQRRKVLVLLTDGEHNQAQTRSGWSPRQAAQVSASLGIPIYAMDAGARADDQESPATVAAREQATRTLQDLANITHGQYFAAGDSAALLTACQSIDRLERAPITSFQYRRYHEAYPWLALSSFVLFVLARTLELTLWRQLP